MSGERLLPRVLVIDDQFGRRVRGGQNREREDLCRTYRLLDITENSRTRGSEQRFSEPLAEAVFVRGQRPVDAQPGDMVENDLAGIIEIVKGGWHHGRRRLKSPWSMVLLDLCFYTGPVTEDSERLRGVGMPVGRPDDEDPQKYFGLEILSALTREFPDLPVVILSSKPRWTVSDEYIRRGAVAFVARGESGGLDLLRELIDLHALVQDSRGIIVGSSQPLLKALRAARRAASHKRPVLLRGERGVGKELFARYLYEHGKAFAGKSFLAVNCGQFRDAPMAFSTLFGHRRGAFTGAEKDREGAVLSVRDGVLFLDEVTSLPLEVQAGLHRLLQEGEVAPLGGEETPVRGVDLKLLAATNTDIEGLTLKDPVQFLPDLLDRFKAGDVITIPPLRERLSDLPALVEHFVRDEESRLGPRAWQGRVIAPEVLDLLKGYEWPGNIRELEGIVRRAVATYPHLEILSVRCFEPLERAWAGQGLSRRGSLDSVLDSIRELDLSDSSPEDLVGRLAEVLGAAGNLVGKYLEYSLQSTLRRTPEMPAGELRIQPAAKFMTGDSDLLGVTAVRLLRKLTRVVRDLGGDQPELIQRATERVARQRKSGGQKDE